MFYKNIINDDVEHLLKNKPGNIKWTLTNEYKKIAKQKCRKAIAEFPDNPKYPKYTVWFSLENPNQYGPMAFNNFGGLILELHSQDNSFHFIAQKIEASEKPKIRNQYDISKAVTSEEYRKILDDLFSKRENELGQRFGREVKFKENCIDCNK